MGVKQKIKGLAIAAYLSEPVRKARAGILEASRRARGQERSADFYFQADAPQSYLMAQMVQRLAAAHPRAWAFHLVPPLAPDVDPAPVKREKWWTRDARELAGFWDLEMPDGPDTVDPVPVKRANQLLLVSRPFDDQLSAALEVGRALWRNDRPALDKALGSWGHEASGDIGPVTQRNYAEVRKRGYYAGSSVYYAGEWYAGVDRLRGLEERLADEDDRAPDGILTMRPESERPPERLVEPGTPLELEIFFSFRSPYSYLAIDRTAHLAERFGLPLRIRPVLPMVTRGLPVPKLKTLFIVRDAKREAERLGIPFGRISDPLGTAVERCLGAFVAADAQGKGLDFTRSAASGIWSEALDPSTYVDMKTIVERAGLDWETVGTAATGEAWRATVADNAEELEKTGLWGVPTFRAGSYSTWGQDRLPLLEDRLRRHVAAEKDA